jgi:hypothetical protein
VNELNNYTYTEIGELKSDAAEEIEEIVWRVDSKISEIIRTSTSVKENLKFEYDAMGNRIAKQVYDELGVLQHSTFYVRDAQGNVMAVYEQEVTVPEGEGPPATPSITYHLTERHIYGSARLGMDRTVVEMAPTTIQAYPLEPTIPATEESERYLGRKYYELSNHLGNVLTVITDEKRMVVSGNNYLHYESVVVSVTDYSPFGVSLTGRTFTTTEEYRYGFQNQETDNENWEGTISYKYRTALNKLGRFISVDPLSGNYPGNSTYAFSMNRLIDGVELEGLEFINYDEALIEVNSGGSIELKLSKFTDAYQDAWESRDRMYQRTGAVYTAPNGQQHIGGVPKVIGSVISPKTSIGELSNHLRKEGFGLEELSNELHENNQRALGNTRYNNNSNKLDGRYNATKHVKANMNASRGLLALEVGALLYVGYSGFKASFFEIPDINSDKAKLKSQILKIHDANKAVEDFFQNNSVNPALFEGENAVNFSRYILTGEMKGSNEAVFDLGDDVLISSGRGPAQRVETRLILRTPLKSMSGNAPGTVAPADKTRVDN